MVTELNDSRESMQAIPKPQLVYGTIVYWITVASCMVCFVGSLAAFALVEGNVLNPQHAFRALFEGGSVEDIWHAAGAFPGGHFYLQHLPAGDAIVQLGIALGCSCALWGLLAACYSYVRERSWGYATASIVLCCIMIFAITGVIQV